MIYTFVITFKKFMKIESFIKQANTYWHIFLKFGMGFGTKTCICTLVRVILVMIHKFLYLMISRYNFVLA